MARDQTDSTGYKYLSKYYTLPGYTVRLKNYGPGKAKVEVREIFDDEYTLDRGKCQNHLVVGYAEVWFKSVDGELVDVETEPGGCPGTDVVMGNFSDLPEIPEDMKRSVEARIRELRNRRTDAGKIA